MRSRRAGVASLAAANAIYVDFEGRTDKPPVLLGYCETGDDKAGPGEVRQVIVDPNFASLGEATHMEVVTLSTAIRTLAASAEATNRPIVAWSDHELNIAKRSLANFPEELVLFEGRYLNARTYAKRWANRLHREWAFPKEPFGGRYTLARFLELTDYYVPSMAGPGNTGDRLEEIERLVRRPKLYEKWTSTQKAKWTNVRRHNTHDVLGMRHVTILAARELANGGA